MRWDGIYDAYSMTSGHIATPKLIGSQLGGAAGMLGDYENDDEKKLTYWLDSAVFEDYQYKNGKIFMDSINERSSPYIYIQRSFTNPAASPAHNAHEIGDRTWKGNNYSDCRDGGTNDGLFLVNFREKKPVYWSDTLDFGVNFMRGFYRDSTILFLAEYEKKFGFWKIGSLPKTLKKISWKTPCKGFDGMKPTQFRPWKDGDVLVINAKGCDYSVLDTASGNVDELSLDGEYAWLKDCDDVTNLNEYVYCLKHEEKDKVKLLQNGILVDSLNFDAFDAYVGDVYGGAVKWNGPFAQIYFPING